MLRPFTAPSAPAVTLAEARLHLRVDVADDDALITSLVAAATAEAEHLMQRAVMPQEWQLVLDSFFDESVYRPPVPLTVDVLRGPIYSAGTTALNLSRPPVTGITSVKYLDATTGTLTTLAASEYVLAAASEYGALLVPAYGKSWPSTRAMADAVQVVFACGYATAALVPEPIKAWVKLRVAALYENRAAWTLGAKINRAEFMDFMLDRYRTFNL